MKERENNYLTIDFTNALLYAVRRIKMLIILTVVFAIVGAGYAQVMNILNPPVPFYKSTAKLYITAYFSPTPSTAAKMAGISFTNEYYELMKSDKVLDQVINDLGLNMSRRELESCISKSVITDTSMIGISVTFPDPELAKRIVDDLLVVTGAYSQGILGMTIPTVYEEAEIPLFPSYYLKESISSWAVKGAAVGLILAVMLIVIFYFAKKNVYSLRQIEDITNRKILSINVSNKKISENCYNEFSENAMSYLFSSLLSEKPMHKVLVFYRCSTEDSSNYILEYANFLSKLEKKVICIDTTISNPDWGFSKKDKFIENDLVDYFEINDIKSKDIVVEDVNFDVIYCTKKVINGMEHLGSSEFKTLIHELRGKYDYVLINTAPMSYVSDAFALNTVSDGDIVVSDFNITDKKELQNNSEKLYKNGHYIGNVVINIKVKARKSKLGRKDRKQYGVYVGEY